MSSDTNEQPTPPRPDPEVVCDRMALILRRKTPQERLAIVAGLWRLARRLVTASVRSMHPDWGEAEIRREVARRMSHGAV
jgi:hypothetical protein